MHKNKLVRKGVEIKEKEIESRSPVNYSIFSLYIIVYIKCGIKVKFLLIWERKVDINNTDMYKPIKTTVHLIQYKENVPKLTYYSYCQTFTLPPCIVLDILTTYFYQNVIILMTGLQLFLKFIDYKQYTYKYEILSQTDIAKIEKVRLRIEQENEERRLRDEIVSNLYEIFIIYYTHEK